jgi:hypothetical protein
LFINPLKTGKLEEYKAFAAEITGPRRKEFVDLLRRYHLKTSEVWHHKLGDVEYVIVRHEVENNVADPLANWPTSTHPFDQWFQQQLNNLHDMEDVIPPNLLFALDTQKEK